MFPWKIQKLNLAPSLSYDSIRRPLKAPKGKRWKYDPKCKEWSLVTAEREKPSIIVDASAAVEDANGTLVTPHHITPSDTFQGICLKYKIKPNELRRANNFTGENLNLVPNPLMIPCKNVMDSGAIAEQVEPLTQSEVVELLLKECRSMSRSEARAYLMLSDWEFTEALEDARAEGF